VKKRMKTKLGKTTFDSEEEIKIRKAATELFKATPISDDELLDNLGLYINSKNMARLLFLNHIYQHIIDIHGIIIDFGTRWGQNMAVFTALRGIYEPFNRHRRIIGFDTFKGLSAPSMGDGTSKLMKEGRYAVPENYSEYLNKIMEMQELDNPVSHIKKYEVIEGDASVEIYQFLDDRPETIIALAYFDMDIYQPTYDCLEAIKPYLVKGSILVFDELNDIDCPGETLALNEVFPLNKIRLKRYRYASRVSYFIVD